jgi:hypothetical protein
MADTDSSGIELSDQPAHPPVNRLQTGIVLETPSESKTHDHSAGKLPPEAPAPTGPFKLHVQSLKNLVSGGLDMKNKADYDALVHPLMDRCGGSIEKLAANINAPLSGGLKEAEGAAERREAFGINRLPEKEMVCYVMSLLPSLVLLERRRFPRSIDIHCVFMCFFVHSSPTHTF